ncbi:MAG TPA: hypothetical protein PK460_01830 [Bacilli bacterium]|nr:hypothetical protein [Bacilli bacterium]HOQ70423.1 hypothetical protein [Bacilli bacterium]HPK29071.1 hypothetical protein [Bacilli bacterium]
MNNHEEKLKKLKNDIPEYPDGLDQKVFRAAEQAPRYKRPGFPKLLIPSLLTVTAVVLSTFFVTKYVYGWNTPSNTPSNSGMPSEPSNTSAEEGEVYDYYVSASAAIPGASLAPEMLVEGKLGYFDIVYIDSQLALDATINQYADDAHPVLSTLTSVIRNNAEFFSESVLIIVPFAHTSTEEGIELTQIEFGSKEQPTKLRFDIYSPEFNDMDTLVTFHLVTIGEWASDLLSESAFKISVHNTFDNSNKSVFYSN